MGFMTPSASRNPAARLFATSAFLKASVTRVIPSVPNCTNSRRRGMSASETTICAPSSAD